MAPKISQDLINARLAPVDPPQATPDDLGLYDGDLTDDGEPGEEGGGLSTPVFVGLAAVLCLLAGGAVFYLVDGFQLTGPAAPQNLAMDARCGTDWQEGMPNDVQLRCYLTSDVDRLCDPAQRQHLVQVLKRHDDDTAKWEKALWQTGFNTVSAVSDRSTELGVLGARAKEALEKGDQAAYMRLKKEADAIAKEIAGEPVNLLKDARHDLPNPELEQEIAKLISKGLLSGRDFWWSKPLLYRRAAAMVKQEDIKPVCS